MFCETVQGTDEELWTNQEMMHWLIEMLLEPICGEGADTIGSSRAGVDYENKQS